MPDLSNANYFTSSAWLGITKTIIQADPTSINNFTAVMSQVNTSAGHHQHPPVGMAVLTIMVTLSLLGMWVIDHFILDKHEKVAVPERVPERKPMNRSGGRTAAKGKRSAMKGERAKEQKQTAKVPERRRAPY